MAFLSLSVVFDPANILSAMFSASVFPFPKPISVSAISFLNSSVLFTFSTDTFASFSSIASTASRSFLIPSILFIS